VKRRELEDVTRQLVGLIEAIEWPTARMADREKIGGTSKDHRPEPLHGVS